MAWKWGLGCCCKRKLIVVIHQAPLAEPTRNVTAFRYDGSEAWTANLTGEVAHLAATADGGVLVFHTLHTDHGDNNHEINVWITKLNNRGAIVWTQEIYNWQGGMSGGTVLPIFRGGGGIAVNSEGEIFVAPGIFFPYPDPNPGGLGTPGDIFMVKLDSAGNHLLDYSWDDFDFGTKNFPRSLRIDGEDNVWLGSLNNRRICVFDGDGNFLREYTNIGTIEDMDVHTEHGVFVESLQSALQATAVVRVRSISDGSTLWSITPKDIRGYESSGFMTGRAVAYDPNSGKVFLGVSPFPESATQLTEQQRITITGATGGTFRIGIKDKWTAPIAHDATVTNVGLAINGMGFGQLTSGSSGGPLGTNSVTIVFNFDAPTMQLDTSELEGDDIVATLEVVREGTPQIALFSILPAGDTGVVQESVQLRNPNALALGPNGILAMARVAGFTGGSVQKFDTTLTLDWERYPRTGSPGTDEAYEVAFTPLRSS